uniref:Uncharacterized protein n=1 Tax=Triticum urartu TaxID=4572 RepID=A0A8R7U4C9_TRIUA
ASTTRTTTTTRRNGGVQVSEGHRPLLTPLLRSVLNRSSSCYVRTAGEDAKMSMEVHGLRIRMKTQ